MTSPPSEQGSADLHELREQVMRLLGVEADLFRRNQQLDAQWKMYRSLADLGKQLHGKLGEAEIAAAIVRFALYSLNLERSVMGLQPRDGEAIRTVAWDGFYDDEQAKAISELTLGPDHPLFDPTSPGQRHRLRSLAEQPSERDEIGRTFGLDEYVWLPLRDGRESATIGYLVAGNSAQKARHHARIIADDPVLLALENLVELASAGLQSARLDQVLATEREQLEIRVVERTREREELLSAIIRTQEQRLDELATPILPIAEDILVMPLIGTMDAARSAQLQSAALEGAATRRARSVILDITGVKAIDATFARALLDTAGGLRLLGVQAVITGVRPEIALALVNLGANLHTLVTHATLQSGVAHAMSRARG
jgi:anti-anti-sigma regulatory factor